MKPDIFSFQRMIDIFIKYNGMFMDGAKVTIVLSFFAVILGTALGILVAFARLYGFKPLRWLSVAYIEFLRDTPLLVQVMIIYFGSAAMGLKFPNLFGISGFNKYVWGLVAVSLNSSAYVAEIVRSGINAVDIGQMEASRSLGMSKPMALRYVVLPQAIRNIMPALANEFVTMIKETSVLYFIGLGDIMSRAGDVIGITFRTVEVYIIAALIYFIIVFSLSKLVGVFERRMNKSATR